MASPRRRSDARQRKLDKKDGNKDNVMAMKVTAGVVIGAVIVGIFISVSSDGSTNTLGDKDRKKRSSGDQMSEIYGDAPPPVTDLTAGLESKLPDKLAQKLLLGIATDDPDLVGKVISWPVLFGKLANENAWEAERRWENLDDAGREQLKSDWLFQLMDPDLQEAINLSLKDDIVSGTAMNSNDNVGSDYGQITYLVTDPGTGKDLVVFHVTSYLLEGYSPRKDIQNPEAWRIGKVAFDIRNAIGSKKKTKKRKAIGEDIGKPKKKKRKKRKRFTGPVEADIGPVAWLEGTDEATKSRIEGLVKEALEDSGAKSAKAREQLKTIGKPAIPGLLNAIAATSWKERSQFRNVIFLVDTLEMITGEVRGVTGSVRLAGLTPPSPAVIEKGLRRWYGWWNNFGPAWVKEEYDPSKETWEQFEEEDEEDGVGK
jgi:hypothetical protein